MSAWAYIWTDTVVLYNPYIHSKPKQKCHDDFFICFVILLSWIFFQFLTTIPTNRPLSLNYSIDHPTLAVLLKITG